MNPLIAANWKMNPQKSKEAVRLFSLISKKAKNVKGADIVICPPFVFLRDIQYLPPNMWLQLICAGVT